jgi:transposase-like protein
MERKAQKPKTLQQAILFFADEQRAIDTVAAMRWPNGPECPACGHKDHYYLASQKRWKCKECGRQFSVKLGTIFEDSAIPLSKWMLAMWMLANCKNGASSYEVADAIGVTQKSAWFMLHRIRLAMKTGSITKLGGNGGEVESDETFVGGKTRFMHKGRLKRMREAQKLAVIPSENPYVGKTPVIGIFDRKSRQIRANVLPNMRRDTLQQQVLNNVEYGAKLYTDNASGYGNAFAEKFAHEVVNHATEYVRGRVHTNSLENFWSLLKRSLHGTYVAVEPFHLDRYVDEQVFRFNSRLDESGNKLTSAERFERLLSQISGKRLTFAEVTGKVTPTQA